MSKKNGKVISIIIAVFMLLTVFAGPIPVGAIQSTILKNPITKFKENGEGVTTWDCIYLGNYPQREVKDEELLATLDSIEEWDSNNDIIFEGVKYHRVQAKDVASCQFSDNNYHYFTYEKIKWRVLDINDDNALIMSDTILDAKHWLYGASFTDSDEIWEKSTIRSWANGYNAEFNKQKIDYTNNNFLDTAFSLDEQKAIMVSKVNATDNYDNDTKDKIYLLSGLELRKQYGFVTGYDENDNYDKTRQALASDYANYSGVYRSTDSTCLNCGRWWMRDGVYNTYYNFEVTSAGGVYPYRQQNMWKYSGFRPVLEIDLKCPVYNFAGTVSSEDTIIEEDNNELIKDVVNINEDELYGSHAKFLKNESYGNMCGTLLTDVEEILWSRSEGKNTLSAFKACLKKGVIENLKAIYSGFSGKFTEEQQLEKEISLELVNDVSKDSLTYSKVMSDVKEMYGLASGGNSSLKEIMEFGFSKPGSKLKAAEAISGGLFSSSDAYMLFENVEKNMGTLKKHLTGVEAVIDSADIAINIAASMDANNRTTKGLRDGIANRNDTALYRGLTELLKVQRQTAETNCVDEFLKYGAEKIAGALVDLASGAFGVAEFAFNVGSYFVPGADIDTVNKVVITSSNANVLSAAKTDAMTAIALNYQNGGKLSAEELGCNYALLYTAYMESVKESVEYALQIATPAQKSKLQKHYNQFKDYLTYEKYIQSCIANANAQWKYKEKNGNLTVTGLVGNSVETSSNEHAIAELFAEPVYASGEDNENIIMDIPDEIDGKKVVAVSDNAFKDNTSLECISLSEEISSIGTSSFSGCTALHTVFLNEKLSSVGDEAFSGCSELNEIEIPYSVNEIGENAFSNINDISIKAADGSAASQYANTNDNVTLENVDLKAISISITELPDKLSYKMSEDIDSTGIKVFATLEDGSEKNVSSEIYCEFKNKQIGTNTVNVYYLDAATSYDVEVVADKCSYTVEYRNEYGEEIAESVLGSAMAGEEIELEIKDIKGYIPDNPSQTAVIGDNNEFVVTYTSVPDVDIEDVTVSEIEPQNYTGKQIKPQVSINYYGETLVKDKDFYLEYGENIDIGTGSVIIIGTGAYTGIKEVEFDISNAKITSKNISLKSSNYSYTGKQIKPVPTITINGKKLVKDTDYIVSYGTNKYPGYGTVKVTGKGNYSGSITKKFTIAKVTGLKVKATGTNHIKLSWNKQASVKGYKVYRLKDGKYKLIKTVKGSKNNYCTIKNLGAGNGYTFKVRSYAGNKPYLSVYSEALSAPTKPAKVVMKKLTTGRTHFVKTFWGKKNGTGYQVMIATNPKFTKNKKTYKITSNKTLSKKITGLKKGKTYYVKVRAYKTFGGKTKYGQWSKYKSIKCK